VKREPLKRESRSSVTAVDSKPRPPDPSAATSLWPLELDGLKPSSSHSRSNPTREVETKFMGTPNERSFCFDFGQARP